jgi:hypothetical protein
LEHRAPPASFYKDKVRSLNPGEGQADRQAQTRAAKASASACIIGPTKTVEDCCPLSRRNASTLVRNFKYPRVPLVLCKQPDIAPAWRMTDRVFDQVVEYTPRERRICNQDPGVRGLHFEIHVRPLCNCGPSCRDLVNEVGYVQLTSRRAQNACVSARHQEQLVHHVGEVADLCLEHCEGAPQLLVRTRPVLSQFDLTSHLGQRAAELMGGVGDEPAHGLETNLQSSEHGVKGLHKLAELIFRNGDVHPAMQVALA